MCGIFGVSLKPGRLSDGRRAVLANNLARLNDTRGGDSWGLLAFLGGDKVRIRRGLGDFQNHAWELADHRVLFGHTRYATTGAKTIKNAHPFEIGSIIGAHNGMAYNHHQLSQKYKRDYEVDSMHYFAHLNEGRNFDDIEGYGSLEWINRGKPGTIFLLRMTGGELSVYGVGSKDKPDGIVWSSKEDHLQKALYTAGLNKKCFPYKVEVGQVYTVVNGEFMYIDKKLDVSATRTSKNPNWQNHYDTGRRNYHQNWQDYQPKKDNATSAPSTIDDVDEQRELEEWKMYNQQLREGSEIQQQELGGEG